MEDEKKTFHNDLRRTTVCIAESANHCLEFPRIVHESRKTSRKAEFWRNREPDKVGKHLPDLFIITTTSKSGVNRYINRFVGLQLYRHGAMPTFLQRVQKCKAEISQISELKRQQICGSPFLLARNGTSDLYLHVGFL